MSEKDIKTNIEVFYSPNDKVWFCQFKGLNGCLAHGNTPQEALKEGLEAKKDWLRYAREEGWTEEVLNSKIVTGMPIEPRPTTLFAIRDKVSGGYIKDNSPSDTLTLCEWDYITHIDRNIIATLLEEIKRGVHNLTEEVEIDNLIIAKLTITATEKGAEPKNDMVFVNGRWVEASDEFQASMDNIKQALTPKGETP